MDGNIVEVNPATCEMYGYGRDQIIGKPIITLIDLDYHTLFDQVFAKIRRGEGFVVRAIDQRSDGSPFHVEVYGSSFTYAGELHMLSVIRDVTERVQATQLLEQRVQERTRELSTLLQVSRDVVSTLETKPLIAQTLNRLGEVVPYHAAAIFGLEEKDDLVLLGYRGPGSIASVPRRWHTSQIEHIRMVLDHREPIVIPDVYADTPRAHSWQESWGTMPGRLADDSASWLGIPLLAKQGVIGLLVLEHRQVGYFTPRHSGLALAFANQVAVALENARLYEQSQRIGVLEERQRIARELHDSVSQALYGIGLGAQTARELLDVDPARAVEPVEYVLSLAEAGLSEMRALIFELRPDALEREGLVSALSKRAEALQARHRVEVATDLGKEPEIPLAAKEAVYRVAQEALNNVIKHARARRIVLSLQVGEGKLFLSIQDDGVGFDPQSEHPGHMGLHTMRERIEELDGTLEIESARGEGTVVRVTVPTKMYRQQ
jgi:PAS domain S-box-containing protein